MTAEEAFEKQNQIGDAKKRTKRRAKPAPPPPPAKRAKAAHIPLVRASRIGTPRTPTVAITPRSKGPLNIKVNPPATYHKHENQKMSKKY
jgi:hypothetical protein